MTQELIDSLDGRVQALSMALASIIRTLPSVNAAQAALHLKVDHEELLKEEQQDPLPEHNKRSRDVIVNGYLELLSAQSSAQRF
ncbi:hypothetical protein [Diaphorobacter caeni]|uniref:hypothetical protein n=1 Tax=Diaphorobacter caeni TaxID=2784387 RepID=UPI0018909AC3|nr:hypothetical protein [Diaphorobacter caeni]MBF5006876.1 hypothetical protein [Diaphorobacter caeni]